MKQKKRRSKRCKKVGKPKGGEGKALGLLVEKTGGPRMRTDGTDVCFLVRSVG